MKWEVYLQKRTQNDDESNTNIFKHHQTSSYWLWLHYQTGENTVVSVTPFCYFNTIGLFPQAADVGNRGIKEFRWAAQIEHTENLGISSLQIVIALNTDIGMLLWLMNLFLIIEYGIERNWKDRL